MNKIKLKHVWIIESRLTLAHSSKNWKAWAAFLNKAEAQDTKKNWDKNYSVHEFRIRKVYYI